MSLKDDLNFPEEELEEFMKGISKDARAENVVDPIPALRLLVDLEVAALKLARDEMRRDGMIPSMTAGRPIWFDTAKAISRYLRERIGMPADPGPFSFIDPGAGGGA